MVLLSAAYFFQGSAPLEKDDNGRTALHHGVLGGSERVVRILLKAGADPNDP